MNCATENLLPQYLLGELSSDQNDLVREHLACCAVCRSELADLEEAVAAVYLPPSAQQCSDSKFEDSVAREVLQRIRAVSAPSVVVPSIPAYRAPLAAALYVVALIAGFSSALFMNRSFDEVLVQNPPAEDRVVFPASRELLQNEPQLRFVAANPNSRLDAQNRPIRSTVLYERRTRELHFLGVNFLPAPGNQRYYVAIAKSDVDGDVELISPIRVDQRGLASAVVQDISSQEARSIVIVIADPS